jgi:hypothetical protein
MNRSLLMCAAALAAITLQAAAQPSREHFATAALPGAAKAATDGELIQTCAGDIWAWNSGGNHGVEIGHGLYQCSLKGPRVTRQILSVCKDKARCTVMIEITKRVRQGSGPPKSVDASRDVDTLEIHDKDRILVVRAGAEDESGYAASEALRSITRGGN